MNAPAPNGIASPEAIIVSALERLERRLVRIEGTLDRTTAAAAAAAQRAPDVAATAVDAFDGFARRAQEAGVDIDQRLRAALSLVERLTAPETSATLLALLALAEKAPALLATLVDTTDGFAASVCDAGIDVHARGKNLLLAAEKLTSPAALSVLQQMLDRVDVLEGFLASGMLDAAPVAIVSRAGQALAATGSEAPPPIGAWGALRATSDPDVQRAVGFALRFAQHFGRSLAGDPAAALGALAPKAT